MARRIWIVNKNTEIDQQVRDDATAHNCPEITKGIPPILKDKLLAQKLPLAYEEPEPPMVKPPMDITSAIENILDRIKILEGEANL